ncbi:hypothetical protein ONZ51_g10504 [Trametes cubensis]|uniref:CxC5 like cysteine cluster associated with KDZ domain-containing protein n=1 Tax=Trametes cubensis TaxID=1111947 RepID=A0AAD7X4T3_9APHY|nr:hypothetical protein ONZ51_g10504 [Trametes cubensis]
MVKNMMPARASGGPRSELRRIAGKTKTQTKDAVDVLDNLPKLLVHDLARALHDGGDGHEPRVLEVPVMAREHRGDEHEHGREDGVPAERARDLVEQVLPRLTAWASSMLTLLRVVALDEAIQNAGEPIPEAIVEDVHAELRIIFEFLGVNPDSNERPNLPPLPPPILCTDRLECIRCPPNETRRSLRRREPPKEVRVLTSNLEWRNAQLFVAHCVVCNSEYYPDSYTYATPATGRRQVLEYSPAFFRISKHGLWAERRVALAQERTLVRFRAGWSNFADWINDQLPHRPRITHRQSRRLFLEHFSRRLLIAHLKQESFSLPAHASAAVLAEHVRREIGANGGVLPSAFDHGCTQCTHVKRYHADLIREGFVQDGQGGVGVAGIDEPDLNAGELPAAHAAPLPEGLPPAPAAQQEPEQGETRGYVRMAVMDGKTVTHRKCALDDCRGPLMDFRSGRFCEDHIALGNICGIMPCGEPVHSPGALTCGREDHKACALSVASKPRHAQLRKATCLFSALTFLLWATLQVMWLYTPSVPRQLTA